MLQAGTEQLVLRNLSGWQRSLDKQPKFVVEDPRPYSAARSDRKHLHCTKILDSTCVPFLNRGTTSAANSRFCAAAEGEQRLSCGLARLSSLNHPTV